MECRSHGYNSYGYSNMKRDECIEINRFFLIWSTVKNWFFSKYLAVESFRKLPSIICGFEKRTVYLFLVFQYFINIF